MNFLLYGIKTGILCATCEALAEKGKKIFFFYLSNFENFQAMANTGFSFAVLGEDDGDGNGLGDRRSMGTSSVSYRHNLFVLSKYLIAYCYGNLKFPLTFMGKKLKISKCCYFTADLLKNFLQKCSQSKSHNLAVP